MEKKITIDKVIKGMQQRQTVLRHFGLPDSAITEDDYIIRWLNELKRLRKENNDLKCALAFATTEIRGCDKCAHGKQGDTVHRVFTCERAEFGTGRGYKGGKCANFRWVHANKVEKLIGKEGN